MKTLQNILYHVNSFVDLERSLPTGDELKTRVDYADRSVWEASAVAQLNEFTKVYEVNSGSNTDITLPIGFREFKTNPQQFNGSTWDEFEEINPEDKYSRTSGSKYCYVLGNPSDGYIAHFNNITANATLSIVYQRYPSGFATYTDKCELSDPMYVVNKTESYVLQARGDDRFPYVDSQADLKLKNMIGRGSKTPGGQVRSARSNFKNPLG
jgi:hypothetical protein